MEDVVVDVYVSIHDDDDVNGTLPVRATRTYQKAFAKKHWLPQFCATFSFLKTSQNLCFAILKMNNTEGGFKTHVHQLFGNRSWKFRELCKPKLDP